MVSNSKIIDKIEIYSKHVGNRSNVCPIGPLGNLISTGSQPVMKTVRQPVLIRFATGCDPVAKTVRQPVRNRLTTGTFATGSKPVRNRQLAS